MPAGKELSGVLIISQKQSGEKIAAMLDPMQFEPVRIVTGAGEGRRLLSHDSFDIVIINSPLSDETGYDLALDIAENSTSGVLLAVKSEIYDETRYRVEDAGVLTISKPLSPAFFQTCINLVTATRRRLSTMEEENAKLRRRIEEIRVVNRAKWALVSECNMTEAQAHRHIEKGAMDERISRREFAQRIIDKLL